MEVWGKVFEGVPFFHEGKAVADVFAAWKVGTDEAVAGGLLGAVADEFAANHAKVRVQAVGSGLEASRFVGWVGLGVKVVCGGVDTHKTFAIADGF